MIASLTGTVQAAAGGQVVLDVSGVGYLVSVTPGTAQGLRLDERTTLLISMIVREDAMLLFGFANAEERDFFDSLRGVSGVGPKLALAILSALTPERIAIAVANEDDKAFSAVSGIGPKTAKLLIVTLAGRLKAQIGSAEAPPQSNAARDSVLLALTGLGIAERSAADALDAVLAKYPSASRDQLLREALAALGSAKAARS